MKLSQTENKLGVAAAKAGMDEKTARKWRRLGHLPREPRAPRQYRTRLDPFARVWREVEQLLERDASVEAKTIFDYLCRREPEQFQEMQLRTLQRRVKRWRAQKGEPREVYFPQEHVAGRQAQSDFTYMNASSQRNPSQRNLKLLLEHGANVNVRDNDGWTVLEIALLGGCPETIDLLIKAGAKE